MLPSNLTIHDHHIYFLLYMAMSIFSINHIWIYITHQTTVTLIKNLISLLNLFVSTANKINIVIIFYSSCNLKHNIQL